MMEPTQLE